MVVLGTCCTKRGTMPTNKAPGPPKATILAPAVAETAGENHHKTSEWLQGISCIFHAWHSKTGSQSASARHNHTPQPGKPTSGPQKKCPGSQTYPSNNSHAPPVCQNAASWPAIPGAAPAPWCVCMYVLITSIGIDTSTDATPAAAPIARSHACDTAQHSTARHNNAEHNDCTRQVGTAVEGVVFPPDIVAQSRACGTECMGQHSTTLVQAAYVSCLPKSRPTSDQAAAGTPPPLPQVHFHCQSQTITPK
jgi:hypothetical protein